MVWWIEKAYGNEEAHWYELGWVFGLDSRGTKDLEVKRSRGTEDHHRECISVVI